MKKLFYDKVEKWTKEMVQVESIVKGGNETKGAEYIYNEYKKMPYFQENPEHLILQKTLDDAYDRHSTLALLKGNGNSKKTIVLMGHFDTVEVDDYGKLKEYAFDPDRLIEEMKRYDHWDEETKKDLESGEYMFGRGTLDMKAGIAGHLAIVDYFSQNLEKLNGNIVALAACDEEDGSHGVISALKQLKKWKEEEGLEYVLAINSDYSTPYYGEDPNRYVYLGTIGKLLPTFFVAGKETHVGQAFAGYDPNLLLGALTEKITFNPELSNTSNGETTIPPMSLRQEDLKEVYTVQTALYAHGYYNFFTHSWTPKDVLERLKKVTEETVDEVNEKINRDYKAWCEKADFPYKEIQWNVPVYTWEEFLEKGREEYPNMEEEIEKYKEELFEKEPNMDIRKYALAVVKYAFEKFPVVESPAVILYYSSVYSQNIELSEKKKEDKEVIQNLRKAVETVGKDCKDPIQVKFFYPYISDSSFLYVPEEEEGIKYFEKNTAPWGKKYKHPMEDMKEISMPVVNIGTYGKDGHKKTERVHKAFTFETIPQLEIEMIQNTLKE
ncbi:M20/M25/M40 family metallo-hydrolase [Peptoniphilus sp. KCTC 25270]|uniref:M20/M25/M40 family metallo-hydrolase n=1 Tax=Peptoniphilus sp. KCTC 25270 TaxID=2897414 RepID=UPI001E345315|nr:M20/M25/M40 family metallo-hydrolase [Peptoniphilus sp. KCTC 25270]MCD1147453.1 M20/M25/M40 family metallo-hydrolase [Peptoniphilus sp. KCTC 25270]